MTMSYMNRVPLCSGTCSRDGDDALACGTRARPQHQKRLLNLAVLWVVPPQRQKCVTQHTHAHHSHSIEQSCFQVDRAVP